MRVSAPLEIEKQKKKEKNVIRANLQLFHLYFATFFSRKYHFLCYFLSWAPPWKIEKQQKKMFAPLTNSWTRHCPNNYWEYIILLLFFF